LSSRTQPRLSRMGVRDLLLAVGAGVRLWPLPFRAPHPLLCEGGAFVPKNDCVIPTGGTALVAVPQRRNLFYVASQSEGDEGKIRAAVAANQPLDQEKRKSPNPDPSKFRKDRPPGKPKSVPRR